MIVHISKNNNLRMGYPHVHEEEEVFKFMIRVLIWYFALMQR